MASFNPASQFRAGLRAAGMMPRQVDFLSRAFTRGLRNSGRDPVLRHDRARAVIAELYLAVLRPLLARAQLQVLHKLHAKAPKITNTTPAAADLLFDLTGFKHEFKEGMREAGTQALGMSGQGMLSELGIARKYVTPAGIIHDFVITRENKLSSVCDEIYDAIKNELEAGIQAGESMDDLADRISAKFDQISMGRAQVIAQTETASAYGTGRMDAMTSAGFTMKSWLTAGDERVRLTHNEAQAEGAIPVGQAFGNGLQYPGDPDGEASEVIGCRCVIQAEQGDEDDES